MITFFIICVALATIGIFLHLLSAYDKNLLDKKERLRLEKDDNFIGADPRLVYGKNWNANIQRPRICPCCGKALKKTEFLYASMGEEMQLTGKKQVHIYGCRFCYLGLTDEVNSNETVRENLDL